MEEKKPSMERAKGRTCHADNTDCKCDGPETLSRAKRRASGLNSGEVGRSQIIEILAGPGKGFGFYSKSLSREEMWSDFYFWKITHCCVKNDCSSILC